MGFARVDLGIDATMAVDFKVLLSLLAYAGPPANGHKSQIRATQASAFYNRGMTLETYQHHQPFLIDGLIM
jgi:hypothetical protein